MGYYDRLRACQGVLNISNFDEMILLIEDMIYNLLADLLALTSDNLLADLLALTKESYHFLSFLVLPARLMLILISFSIHILLQPWYHNFQRACQELYIITSKQHLKKQYVFP